MTGIAIGVSVAVAAVMAVIALFVEWRDLTRPQEGHPQEPLRGFRRLAGALFVLLVVVGGALAIALAWPPEDLHP